MAKESSICPHCQNTGWIFKTKNGRETASPCSCQKGESSKNKLDQANIPHRFLGCDLKGYLPVEEEIEENNSQEKKTSKKKNRWQEKAKETAERFIADYPATAGGLTFIGPTGVGKTRLLCSIGNQLIREKQVDVYYIDWNDLVREMRSGEEFASRDFQSIGILIQKLATVELLLFDELGSSLPSPWVLDNIYYLINRRYNENRTTLFASNYILKKSSKEKTSKEDVRKKERKNAILPNRWNPSDDENSFHGDLLVERIGERILSRIYEMSTLVDILGEDYRRQWGPHGE